MEILQRVIKRMPSFWVVDMPPDSSILFSVDDEKLMQLVRTKNQDILQELGGVDGVISALISNEKLGIRGDAVDLGRRRSVFGSNTFPKSGASKCLYSILCGLIEFSIIMTLACAVYLIAAGISLYGRRDGWQEGAYALIFSSVFFVFTTMVELGIDWYFGKVKESGHFVTVLRNGLKQFISFSEVVAGDIVFLKSGDKIPADGLFLDGDRLLKLDESHLSGNEKIVEVDNSNPFLSAGAKLVEGQAKMVVTSVGTKTVCYEKQSSLYHQENTLLHSQVYILARYLETAKWILAVSFLPISLARYFTGNMKDGDGYSEFNPGETSALEVSYVFVENIFAVVAISIAMDTTNFSWAVKASLGHAIDQMAKQNIVVRALSAWERIGLGVATINVVDESNTLSPNQMNVSKFLSIPQFVENKEASSLVSPNVLDLIRQGIGLNTTGIAYRAVRTCKHEFSGSSIERAILSQADLEFDMDWENLNQNCVVLKVKALGTQGREILVQKDEKFHVHIRGSAEMILEMCSSFYDASGSLSSLSEDARNLIEEKLQSISSGAEVQVIAHRQISEEELINDPDLNENNDSYSLLGFVALVEIHQDGILKKVVEECLNAGVGINVITNENPVNGAAELGVPESKQSLKDKTLPEGTMINEEDDKSVSMGSEGEEIIENSTDIATKDQLKVAEFRLVVELTGTEAVTSIPRAVLELLNKGIGLYAAENVVSCDEFSGSLIEKAVISWANHELKLDLKELEKNFSINTSEHLHPEDQGFGFLMNIENGMLHVHKGASLESILAMCSSYYRATGEITVLGDHEKMLVQQKVQDLESSECHWIAFVDSQVSQEEHPRDNLNSDRTFIGILILGKESQEVKDNEECHTENGVVLEPSHDESDAANEVKVSSEREVFISMGIEGDESTRSSDIIILDGKCSSLTSIMRWASCTLNNTQMFLQFQLTTSITSILNTYISTVSLPATPGVDTRLVYVLVQLIWVNLGMGLIAAVIFGRQKPEPCKYKPPAEGKKGQLVTGFMWRNIMAQVAYQVIAISILQFKRPAVFGDDTNDTITFVMPMFLQVFNMINARKIEEKNIFSRVRPSFVWLVAILMVVPFVLVEILAHSVSFAGLDWQQWTLCIGIGLGCWPVGFAVKFVPVGFFASPFMFVHHKLKGMSRLLKS